MPKGNVPAEFHDILDSTTPGHLATVDEEGRPEVNPVWFPRDGQHLLLRVKASSRKYKHLRPQPYLAISLLDLTNPQWSA
ncbi:MAG: pyridoxamine 5'-phosphate oxidase family protein [Chloroflexia bacterium]|nr:pyridoxamine 5'-phosphate oxidase family protein [Chloroflexia bacterium]